MDKAKQAKKLVDMFCSTSEKFCEEYRAMKANVALHGDDYQDPDAVDRLFDMMDTMKTATAALSIMGGVNVVWPDEQLTANQ